MQFEDASRRVRRLALVLATLAAPTTLLPTSAAAAPGAARHEQRSELAGRTARSHTTVLLARGSGYRQAGGSPAVRALQRRLTRLGYAPGPVDGRFGPRTQAAVLAFQTRQGLTADGLVGPRTGGRLHALRTTVSRGVGLDRRHGSSRVRSLQRRLQRLGYHPGPLDGRFGPRTEAAVIAFQRDHRLVGDGIAGPLTYAALRTTRRPGQTPARPQPSPSPAAPSTQPSPPTQTAPTQTAPPPATAPSATPTTPSTQAQPAPPAQTQTTPPAQTPATPSTQTQPVPAEPTGGSVPSLAAVVLIALAALVLAVVVIAVLPFLLVSGTGRRPRPRRRQRRPAGAPPDSLTPKRPPKPPPDPAPPPLGNGSDE
jgi:peptidoglycan hydrolase-like protein with peptidoglycan-binding domain